MQNQDQLHTCSRCGRESKASDFIIKDRFLVCCKNCQQVRGEQRFETICPPLYRQTQNGLLSNMSRVLDWKPTPEIPGLLLIGPTGKGKSRCAWRLVERLLTRDLVEVTAFDCVSFGHELCRRFRDEAGPEDWLDSLAACPVLFFDDLGKLKITDRVEAELFGIIERRCANQLPIVATSNDSAVSLSDRMSDNRGPALIRRLREFCQVIDF